MIFTLLKSEVKVLIFKISNNIVVIMKGMITNEK